MDISFKFSNVTFRNLDGQVVARERLDHRDREKLKRRLSQLPDELSVAMEASFGWAWLGDLMIEAGLKPQLSNCMPYTENPPRRAGSVKGRHRESRSGTGEPCQLVVVA
ncbi:MAG: hypothetical protein SVV80_06315 [Planctomycetota bacterium]|nr:hypothetical protein [Planctomycetota bacterium]